MKIPSLDDLTLITKTMGKGTLLIVFFIMLMLGWAFTPIVIFWALNTIFPVLAIPYTLENWAAGMMLYLILTPDSTSFCKNK